LAGIFQQAANGNQQLEQLKGGFPGEGRCLGPQHMIHLTSSASALYGNACPTHPPATSNTQSAAKTCNKQSSFSSQDMQQAILNQQQRHATPNEVTSQRQAVLRSMTHVQN
jgi:hypothetical protein